MTARVSISCAAVASFRFNIENSFSVRTFVRSLSLSAAPTAIAREFFLNQIRAASDTLSSRSIDSLMQDMTLFSEGVG